MRRTITSLLPTLGVALLLGGGQLTYASILETSVGHTACENAGANGCSAQSSYVTGDGAGGTIHVVDFNDGTLNDPNGVATYSGDYSINGDSRPGADSTNYLDIGHNVTITFSTAVSYFGLQWGSSDSYNGVAFYNGDTQIASFTGGGTGDSYVSFNAVGETFNKVVLTSTGCCFETDNHAYVIAGDNAAPEPGTLTTAGTIFVAIPAYVMWRRRRQANQYRD